MRLFIQRINVILASYKRLKNTITCLENKKQWQHALIQQYINHITKDLIIRMTKKQLMSVNGLMISSRNCVFPPNPLSRARARVVALTNRNKSYPQDRTNHIIFQTRQMTVVCQSNCHNNVFLFWSHWETKCAHTH